MTRLWLNAAVRAPSIELQGRMDEVGGLERLSLIYEHGDQWLIKQRD